MTINEDLNTDSSLTVNDKEPILVSEVPIDNNTEPFGANASIGAQVEPLPDTDYITTPAELPKDKITMLAEQLFGDFSNAPKVVNQEQGRKPLQDQHLFKVFSNASKALAEKAKTIGPPIKTTGFITKEARDFHEREAATIIKYYDIPPDVVEAFKARGIDVASLKTQSVDEIKKSIRGAFSDSELSNFYSGGNSVYFLINEKNNNRILAEIKAAQKAISKETGGLLGSKAYTAESLAKSLSPERVTAYFDKKTGETKYRSDTSSRAGSGVDEVIEAYKNRKSGDNIFGATFKTAELASLEADHMKRLASALRMFERKEISPQAYALLVYGEKEKMNNTRKEFKLTKYAETMSSLLASTAASPVIAIQEYTKTSVAASILAGGIMATGAGALAVGLISAPLFFLGTRQISKGMYAADNADLLLSGKIKEDEFLHNAEVFGDSIAALELIGLFGFAKVASLASKLVASKGSSGIAVKIVEKLLSLGGANGGMLRSGIQKTPLLKAIIGADGKVIPQAQKAIATVSALALNAVNESGTEALQEGVQALGRSYLTGEKVDISKVSNDMLLTFKDMYVPSIVAGAMFGGMGWLHSTAKQDSIEVNNMERIEKSVNIRLDEQKNKIEEIKQANIIYNKKGSSDFTNAIAEDNENTKLYLSKDNFNKISNLDDGPQILKNLGFSDEDISVFNQPGSEFANIEVSFADAISKLTPKQFASIEHLISTEHDGKSISDLEQALKNGTAEDKIKVSQASKFRKSILSGIDKNAKAIISNTANEYLEAMTSMGRKGNLEKEAVSYASLLYSFSDVMSKALGISTSEYMTQFAPLINQRLDSVKSRFDKFGSFYSEQSEDGAVRRNFIDIFSKKKGVIFHELGHFFISEMFNIAKQDNAPQWIRDDVAELKKKFGITEEMSEAEFVVAIEKVADQFFSYLERGKAPSVRLQRFFNLISSWLTSIYRMAKEIVGIDSLDPEVASIFDRLLATEKEIAIRMEYDNVHYLANLTLEDAKELGVSDKQMEALAKLKTDAFSIGQKMMKLPLPSKTELAKYDREILKLYKQDGPSLVLDNVRKLGTISKASILNAIGQERAVRLFQRFPDIFTDVGIPAVNFMLEADFKNSQELTMLSGVPGLAVYLEEAMSLSETRESFFREVVEPSIAQDVSIVIDEDTTFSAYMTALDNLYKTKVRKESKAQVLLSNYRDQLIAKFRVQSKAIGELDRYEEQVREKIQIYGERIESLQELVLENSKIIKELEDQLTKSKKTKKTSNTKLLEKKKAELDKLIERNNSIQQDIANHISEQKRKQFELKDIEKANKLQNQLSALIATIKNQTAFDPKNTIHYTREVAELLADIVDVLESQTMTQEEQNEKVGMLRQRILQFATDMRENGAPIDDRIVKYTERFFNEETLEVEFREVDIPFFTENLHYKDNSVQGIEALYDMLYTISKIGKQFKDGHIIDKLVDTIEKNKVKKDQPVASTEKQKEKKLSKTFFSEFTGSLRAFFQSFPAFVAMADGGIGAYGDYVWHKYVLNPISNAVNDADARYWELLSESREDLKAIVPKEMQGRKAKKFWMDYATDADGNVNQLGSIIRSDGTIERVPLSNAGLLELIMHFGNSQNREVLLRNNKITLEEVVRFAPSWMFDIAANRGKRLESMWPEINALNRRVLGVPLERVEATPFIVEFKDKNGNVKKKVKYSGWYYPLTYVEGTISTNMSNVDIYAKSLDELVRGSYDNKSHIPFTIKSHTYLREENVKGLISFDPTTYQHHLKMITLDLYMREPLIKVTRLLKNEKVKNKIIAAYGISQYNQLFESLEAVGVDRIKNVESRIKGRAGSIVQAIRGNIIVGALMYKMSTAIMQLSGLSSTMQLVGTQETLIALKDIIGGTEGVDIFALSKYMSNRKTFSLQQQELRERAIESLTRNKTMSNYERIGFSLIGHADFFVAQTTWLAAYRAAITKGFTQEDAIYAADSAVSQTQGSGRVLDKTGWQRITTIGSMFTSFFSAKFGQLGVDFDEAARARQSGEYGRMTAKYGKILFNMFFLPAIFAMIIRGAVYKDDAEDWSEYRNRFIKQLFGQMASESSPVVPIAGSIFERMLRDTIGLSVWTDRSLPDEIGNDVWKAFGSTKNLWDVFFNDESFESKDLLNIIKALQLMTPRKIMIPQAQISTTFKGAEGIATGEVGVIEGHRQMLFGTKLPEPTE